MAIFNGTVKDFEKFIGPRLRNFVQTSIAKKYKKQIGKCETPDCINTNLEAAHKHGNERKVLIYKSLQGNIDGDIISNLDLNLFEEKFKKLHYPTKDSFFIMCKDCHRKYDKVEETIYIENVHENSEIEQNFIEKSNGEILKIEFTPNDNSEFKELLLEHKSALITIFYNEGNSKVIEWNASNMNDNSDVIGNLRSRPDFRQGKWQELKISRVEVEVNY